MSSSLKSLSSPPFSSNRKRFVENVRWSLGPVSDTPWLAGPRVNADVLERAARSAYLNPLNLPDEYKGKPAEIIAALRETIAGAQKKIAELKSVQTKLREAHQQHVQQMLWNVRSSRMLTDAIVRYGRLKYTYLIVGWVISSRIPRLTERIKKISSGTLIETFPAKRDSGQNVPVLLRGAVAVAAEKHVGHRRRTRKNDEEPAKTCFRKRQRRGSMAPGTTVIGGPTTPSGKPSPIPATRFTRSSGSWAANTPRWRRNANAFPTR